MSSKTKKLVTILALFFVGFLLLRTVHTHVFPYLQEVSENQKSEDHDHEEGEECENEHEDEDHEEYEDHDHEEDEHAEEDHDHDEGEEGHGGKGNGGKGYGRGKTTTTEDYLKFIAFLTPIIIILAIAAKNSLKMDNLKTNK